MLPVSMHDPALWRTTHVDPHQPIRRLVRIWPSRAFTTITKIRTPHSSAWWICGLTNTNFARWSWFPTTRIIKKMWDTSPRWFNRKVAVLDVHWWTSRVVIGSSHCWPAITRTRTFTAVKLTHKGHRAASVPPSAAPSIRGCVLVLRKLIFNFLIFINLKCRGKFIIIKLFFNCSYISYIHIYELKALQYY